MQCNRKPVLGWRKTCAIDSPILLMCIEHWSTGH